jgi:hypothetical protein
MSSEFEGLTPREIDELAAGARREAEDRILEATGLGVLCEAITQKRTQLHTLARQQKKAATNIKSLRNELRALRVDEEARIYHAQIDGVSTDRLLEITSRDRSALSRIRTGSSVVPELGEPHPSS